MIVIVTKGLGPRVWIRDSGHTVVVRIASDGGNLTVFALNRVKIIFVRICVIGGRALRLPRGVLRCERKLNLSHIAGNRIQRVVGAVAVPIGHIIDVLMAIVSL